MKARNRKHRCVWIELERGTDEENEVHALKATQMLHRLGVQHDYFSWNEKKQCYLYHMGEGGIHGYFDLPEDGHMFNLDFLAG